MTTHNSKILEVCLSSDNLQVLRQNLTKVCNSGAQRIELCANMAQNGITPSTQAMALGGELVSANTELLVMIRPTACSFVVDSSTLKLMLNCIDSAAAHGASGVVFGVLTNAGDVDAHALEALVRQAQRANLKCTFHRAFDAIDNQFNALDTLINLGIDRVLSSGTPWQSGLGAAAGIERLRALASHARGRLELVVGGGITPNNAAPIWQKLAQQYGPISLHSYASVHRAQGLVSRSAIEAILDARD
ncbi:copper homeostasis protein CutC [Pseudoalteromonas sp. T1lg75]|uniref:copper homeostasis protein CutC n=1 Tax=Pseudoalteromonas sp. T1lg75 TaxID=2077102 RepID=UPI001319DC50|nr:copper homeostasis protein CutC [Pseudoalteromonas sp. T1lg75]